MREPLIDAADRYLGEYLDKIERATAELPEERLWWRSDERSNSIGNLLLHLDGNLSMWILAGLLGEPYERHRSAEFAARGGGTRAELVARLGATIARCRAGIRALAPADLERARRIQGYGVDGYQALLHAVEHTSYHTGQIVMLAKALLPAGVELEFYPQHRGE